MTATAIAPADAPQRLTYPISPEYVKRWTAERAISELVANAADEDADFTFEWADGVLTIEDQGNGIPEAGLVLGHSNKNSQQIGQFGEGKKIAALVLARDRAIGRVRFETVGYAFEPSIVRASLLAGRGGDGVDMLAYDFEDCSRKRGTRITIECTRKLADKVRSRFLHFTEGYVAPEAPGRVVDGPGGRIYIGGVLVSDDRPYLFSYDFALESAKSAQNRDRTVVDSNATEQLIGQVLETVEDPAVLRKLVEKALAGDLHRAEYRFSHHTSPARRKAFRAIAKDMFAGRKVCYSTGSGETEALLDLRDRGYEVVGDDIEGYKRHQLMTLLGVKDARSIFRSPTDRGQKTKWVKTEDLTEARANTMAEAVRIIRGFYGPDAVDRCDAYEWTKLENADEELHFGGFYDPRSGRIGIKVGNLDDLTQTMHVLFHEVAHRRRHRGRGSDYADRTRGFENELESMGTMALLALAAAGAVPDVAEQEQAKRESEEKLAGRPDVMTHKAIDEAMSETGLTAGELADDIGVSTHCLKQMRSENVRSDDARRCAAPKLASTVAVADRLGLYWPAVHLTLLTRSIVAPDWSSGDRTFRGSLARRKAGNDHNGGRIRGVRGDEIQKCIDQLRADGKPAELVKTLQAQLDLPFETEDGAWLEPYAELATMLTSTPE